MCVAVDEPAYKDGDIWRVFGLVVKSTISKQVFQLPVEVVQVSEMQGKKEQKKKRNKEKKAPASPKQYGRSHRTAVGM